MPIASAFRSALHVLGAAVIALLSPALWAQSGTSSAADGFNPNVNGNVFALAIQPDGKILIGGKFTEVQPNGAAVTTLRSNLARLLPDGRNDDSFNGSTDGEVTALVLQPDGRIVIGGKFTKASGQDHNHLARLNADGSVDNTFNPSLTGRFAAETTVSALVLQPDGAIVAGGVFFDQAGSTLPRNLARFKADGSLDATFLPKPNLQVLALALQVDGKILVGGGFTTLQPNGAATTTTRNRIARLNVDGTVDSFDPNANNMISAIAVRSDGSILIGGTFTTLQPNGTDTAVGTMARLALLNTDGTLATGFTGYSDGQVSAIKLQSDGMILVGGPFSSVGTGSMTYAARLYPTGALDYNFRPAPNFAAYAFGVQPDGSVVLAGGFTTLRTNGTNPLVRNHVARVTAGGSLDADFRPDVNGRVRSLALQSDGKILVGGSFTSIGGASRTGIARLGATGAVDPTFKADVDGIVLAAAQQADGYILIGGTFGRVSGSARPYFARLKPDGSLDETFNCATNAAVSAIKIQADGKVLLGGAFTQLAPLGTVEPVSRAHLSRLNTDGTLDLSFYPSVADSVFSIVLQSDKKILIGGSFTSVLGTAEKSYTGRMAVARLNEDGTVDSGFDPRVNGVIYALGLQADGKVVLAGTFQQMAPNGTSTITDRHNLARVNGDGTLDASFDPDANDTVDSVVVQADGKLVIGGLFTALHPAGAGISDRYYVARLETTGAVDAGYDPNPDVLTGNGIVALALLPSGKVLIAGSFASLKPNGGTTTVQRNRLALINTNGTVDESFNSDLGIAPGPAIESIVTQSDALVIVSGQFDGINGTKGSNLAAFYSDSTPNTAFVPTIDGPVHALALQPVKGAPLPTQRNGFAWLEKTGQLRTGFNLPDTVTLGTVRAIAVDKNNKILIAGDLSISGVSVPLARFLPNGTQDTAFAPNLKTPTETTIYSLEIQSDGRIIVGGSFTSVNDTARSNVARLNDDGTLDASFNPVANGAVMMTLTQPDNKVILGGNFTSLQPGTATTATTRYYIGRINADGTLDATFDPTADGPVISAVVQADKKVIIGGNFTTLRPNGATTATSRTYLARVNEDGTLDTNFDLKANGAVSAMAVQADNKVLLGGYFTSLAGSTRNYVARINADGTLDSFNPNPNGTVSTILVQADGNIVISGLFTALEPNSSVYNAGTATPRNRVARLLPDGSIDPTYNPNFNSQVTRMTLNPADQSILFTGGFTTIQPTGSLIAGGAFSYINGLPIRNLALFGGDGSISSTFQPNPNGAVWAVQPMSDGRVVVAGSFTSLSGATRNRIARFKADDSLDTFDPNANADVLALAMQPDGKLLVGGAFTAIAGSARNYLARLDADGLIDTSFNPSVTGAVQTIAVQADGRVLITYAGTGAANRLVRLNADGGIDGSFNPANDGAVNAVALQTDGRIVVGGSFTTIAGSAQKYLARLNPNGSLDPVLTAQPNGEVTALTIQADGKIVIGGKFTAVDGLPRFGLARIGAPARAGGAFALGADRAAVTWVRSGGSPEVSGVVFESSVDAIEWTTLGAGTRVTGTGNWRYSGLNFADATFLYVRANAIAPSSPHGSAGVITAQGRLDLQAPAITSATAVGAAVGTGFFYAVAATNQPTAYAAVGLPAGLSLDRTTGFISGTPTQSGTFVTTISAINASGSDTVTLTLFVAASSDTANPGRLINLSINGKVTAGNPIIAGFVIGGTAPQTVLLRGVGPGMSVGGVPVSEQLATPRIRLFDSSSVLLQEAGSWGGNTGVAALFTRLGAFPLGATSTDAAIVVTLKPGAYSLHVADGGTAGGRALAEVYDASTTPPPVNAPRLMNLSARGIVSAGETVTGGFVITGTSSKRVLVRGIGPTLANYGVMGVLSDPTVTVYSVSASSSKVIAQNDNWQTPATIDAAYPAASAADLAAAFTSAGAFSIPAGSTDAAVLITLAPGVYAAEVKGASGATGAALVEVYELP